MSFISYAPNQEDLLLLHAFGESKIGKLVTITQEDRENTKSDPYCSQITRLLSERGWLASQLIYQDGGLTQEIGPPLLNSPLAMTDLLVLPSVNVLNLTMSQLHFETLNASVIVIQNCDSSSDTTAPSLHWQSMLEKMGYQLTKQIASSLIFSSIRFPEIHNRLNQLLVMNNFITEEHLNLKIALTESKLEHHLISEQLKISAFNLEQTQKKLHSLTEDIACLAKDHYFVPKQPQALAKKIFRKIMAKFS
jgi:hypothetical protein